MFSKHGFHLITTNVVFFSFFCSWIKSHKLFYFISPLIVYFIIKKRGLNYFWFHWIQSPFHIYAIIYSFNSNSIGFSIMTLIGMGLFGPFYHFFHHGSVPLGSFLRFFQVFFWLIVRVRLSWLLFLSVPLLQDYPL